jgi:arginine-tRNA-protein transferase
MGGTVHSSVVDIDAEIPVRLSGPEYDRLLAGGWFRAGPVLFRSPVLHLDCRPYEVVHVRLPLDLDPPSRSRRRLLRKNRARFRVAHGPAEVDDDARRLYRGTRQRFVGYVAAELDAVALCGEDQPFDTREVRVFDGERVVAIGYYDVGHRAVASILGLHDPAYARHSLGIFTMLEEMALAREAGLRWYYPGYVIPGLPGFDYKLGLGAVQFLGASGRWRRRTTAPTATPHADRAALEMARLEVALTRARVPFRRRSYPWSLLGSLQRVVVPFVRGPWHLSVPTPTGEDELIVEVHARRGFHASTVHPVPELDPYADLVANASLDAGSERRVLAYKERVALSASEDAVAEAVAHWLGGFGGRGPLYIRSGV